VKGRVWCRCSQEGRCPTVEWRRHRLLAFYVLFLAQDLFQWQGRVRNSKVSRVRTPSETCLCWMQQSNSGGRRAQTPFSRVDHAAAREEGDLTGDLTYGTGFSGCQGAPQGLVADEKSYLVNQSLSVSGACRVRPQLRELSLHAGMLRHMSILW
jgi:hypothetical protein